MSLFLCGCAYHRVGWNNTPRQVIHVYPVVNNSGQIGINGILWQQLTKEISTCPGFTAGTLAEAEFILYVSIDDFAQSIGTTSPVDSDSVHSYIVTATASCKLVEKDTRKEFLSTRTTQAVIALPTSPSLIETKRQAASQICDTLSKKICNLLPLAKDQLP
ncbi:MAG: hypothetical protein LBI34_02080 [Puniceicoccales bacterium]|nr:hypothetical protein [Puniceicoccales bacterium]